MVKLQLNRSGQFIKLPNKLLEFEPTHASRYWILASMLASFGEPSSMTILDVGGKKGLLRFFSGFKPTILDMEESDEPNFIQGDALNLPFVDNSYDYVTSCDVLEHIPEKDRERFVLEMIRVSKKGVIICAPFNNSGVSEAEKEMNKYHRQLSGENHRWLKEHIDNGLPNEAVLESSLNKNGIHYGKFHHFSLDVWKQVVSFHLIQFAYSDSPAILKEMRNIYKSYYEHLGGVDFSEQGYRTFYLISKKEPVEIQMPTSESIERAKEQFKQDLYKRVLDALADDALDARDLRGRLVAIQAERDKRYIELETEIYAILNSRRWRAVSKIAKLKSLMTRGNK